MVSEAGMAGRQVGFWDVEHRLRQLSERGDPMEKLASTVDFEIFRAELVLRWDLGTARRAAVRRSIRC